MAHFTPRQYGDMAMALGDTMDLGGATQQELDALAQRYAACAGDPTMEFTAALGHLTAGGTLCFTCPDGSTRTCWGYNPATGDLFITGWPGDVWAKRETDGKLWAEFV